MRFPFWLLDVCCYVLLTPLRFINACFYNIIVHLLYSCSDYFLEIVYPQNGGMYKLEHWAYFWRWFLWLPKRLVKYGLYKSFMTIFDGMIFTVVDTFVPALTLYHGTSAQAGFLITAPGDFKVGGGNYAGSGIYFGAEHRTCQHYAGEDGVIIIARVTLGRTLNLSLARDDVRRSVSYDGSYITSACLKKGYVSTEWWRNEGVLPA